MPDLNNAQLISFKNWTLRIRESTHPSPRLLLMIHGFTGDENSMWVFGRDMPEPYWIVAPRAPYASQPSGYSWRPPEYENLNQLSLDQLRVSADALINLVDEYSASVGLEASKFDVMGFSQGGAMSSAVAFLYPQRIRRVGILAGFVPGGLESLVLERPLEGKPFFVAHGTKDETVPVDRARAAVAILEQAGAQVTYCEDEVGHKVSIPCLRGLKQFFADQRSTPQSGSVDPRCSVD
jgi:phospholipase/carboxylesterase